MVEGNGVAGFTAIAILIGFGHSILAMSGESRSRRSIADQCPKENLQRRGMVIFFYSLIFTGLVSFFAVAIIPDSVRPQYYDNLISGLAMNVVGPITLRLVFQGVVVVVGFLMLAGAVNTAIVGSNGVLNRVSEDGVLTDWFRKPHRRFGTTYRLINLIVPLPFVPVLISSGHVICWAKPMRSASSGASRSTRSRCWCCATSGRHPARLEGAAQPEDRRARAAARSRDHRVLPLHRSRDQPVHETDRHDFRARLHRRFLRRVPGVRADDGAPARAGGGKLDHFQLTQEPEVGFESLHSRPGAVLVPVRDYNTLSQLDWAVGRTPPDATSSS